MKILKRRKKQDPFIWGLIMLLWVGGMAACQSSSDGTASPTDDVQQPVQQTQSSAEEVSVDDEQETPKVDDEQDAPKVDDEQDAPINDPSDPAVIQQDWQSSPHANAFVLDADGNNNPCARCHAPIDWLPSMDDLPETCFVCKFELEDPPSYISEDKWMDIPCTVCHEPDGEDDVHPEYAWLEIAALEEYVAVATPTELCMKCHDPINVPEHGNVQVGGGHEGYECTDCHNAHSTVASCGAVDCHEDVIDPDAPIAGHDGDHQDVSCVACHDAAGMEVGPSEELGFWTTFAPWSYETIISETETNIETGIVPLASHNLVLDASCERCHFAGNPWGLSDSVDAP